MSGFAPRNLLDVGAGTGAAAWAAAAVWPTLSAATLLDREPAMVALGRRLAATAGEALPAEVTWQVGSPSTPLPPRDLVVAAYLLGELPDADRAATIARLWAATTTALVLVEPGSRAGFERILAARSSLIEAGAAIAAPCPGTVPCPVRSGPAWCHFLARLDRSPLHRRAKGAALSWEDEPYAYVVAVRPEAGPAVRLAPSPRVVLGRPRRRPGVVALRVCRDGRVDRIVRSRRDRAAYRAAGDLAWGDRVPPEVADDKAAAGDAGDGQDS
mgnify:CR=1 FL=1